MTGHASSQAADRPGPTATVALIGYRGSGKTAVGAALAARLGGSFVDLDERIENAAGCSIRTIFDIRGEAEFRRLECAALADVLRRDAPANARSGMRIVSVGGGAILSAANRELLKAQATCIWLTAPPEELLRRTNADPRTADMRPALTGREPLEEIRDLLAEREPLYAELADHVVPTAGRSVADVVDALWALIAGSEPGQ